MTLTDWIQAISSVVAAVAAIGAWLFSKQSREEVKKIKIQLAKIEQKITVHNGPVFNMGDSPRDNHRSANEREV